MGSGMLFRNSTKNNDITRLAKINHTLRFFTRKKGKKNINKRPHDLKDIPGSRNQQVKDGSMQGLLWHGREMDGQRRLTGDESPIASLRHLHDKQRLGIDESLVISEDESAIHELTDDDEEEEEVKVNDITMTTVMTSQSQGPPSCPHPLHTKLVPPIIQINSLDHHENISNNTQTTSVDTITQDHSPERTYSLPVPLDSSQTKRKQLQIPKDTISKSKTHCNGVSQKSRAGNVESVKWKKYKDSRNGPESGTMLLPMSNDTENQNGESDIYEIDDRIMWL